MLCYYGAHLFFHFSTTMNGTPMCNTPRLHLLIGDSIARDAGLHSRLRHDEVLNLAKGGATWATTARDLDNIIDTWTTEAAGRGRRLGDVIIWITGNDVYKRHSARHNYNEAGLARCGAHAGVVCRRLLARGGGVTLLGPLPRLSGDVTGSRWETTASYHLERRLKHSLPPEVRLVQLGRQLLRRTCGGYRVTAECAPAFRRDGVHLTAQGYARLAAAKAMPEWVAMTAAHR